MGAINVEDKAMSWISQFAGNLEEVTKNPIDLDIAKKYTLYCSRRKLEGYVDGQLIREWNDNRFNGLLL